VDFKLGFVLFVGGATGSYMLYESVRTWRRRAFMAERRFEPPARPKWFDRLPLHTRVRKSETVS
jgi:hypothetical protein